MLKVVHVIVCRCALTHHELQRTQAFRRAFERDGCPMRAMRAPDLAVGLVQELLQALPHTIYNRSHDGAVYQRIVGRGQDVDHARLRSLEEAHLLHHHDQALMLLTITMVSGWHRS